MSGIDNPASLSGEKAEAVYAEIQAELTAAFARSGEAAAADYSGWRRYNRVPYLSSTHGDRYINNFANEKAAGYDALQKGSRMQNGAVFAKDGFAVSSDGEVLPGRLFIMEKLGTNSSPSTGDWRYVTIDSDGSIIGDSTKDPQNTMEFCHVCHKVRASKDFLFFVHRATEFSSLTS